MATEEDQAGFVEKSRLKYVEAAKAALAMPPTDPLRLSVSLNHSVLLREVATDEDGAFRATAVAQAAQDAAMPLLEKLSEQECVPHPL